MKKYESLKQYIEENHIKQIKSAFKSYIIENEIYASSEEYKNREKYGLKVKLEMMQISKIAYFKSPECSLDFDILYYFHIFVYKTTNGRNEISEHYDCFTFKCSAELCDGFKKFKVVNVSKGNNVREYDKDKGLSEFLTPYIGKGDYKKYADEFLKKYYPIALERPTQIKAYDLARKMGLTIVFGKLNEGVNGKILFRSAVIEAYNFKTRQYEPYHVLGGTIVINIESKLPKIPETIIHECIHWWLHRKYFELQMLLNTKEYLKGEFIDEMKMPDDKKMKNKYFMELQARAITSAVLMPEEASRLKFESILKRLESRKTYHSKRKTYFCALFKFAEFFNVTPNAAKYRLENLGYSEIHYLKQLNEHKNMKPFKSSIHTSHGQTYIVDFDEGMKALRNNAFLNEYLDKGYFIYVDGFFVLNNDKFIKYYKNGRIELSNEALSDVSKCCILFDTDIEAVSTEFDPKAYNLISCCSGGAKNEYVKEVSVNKDNQKFKDKALRAKEEIQEAHEIIKIMNNKSTFHEKFDCLCGDECLGYRSNRRIATLTGISDKTINRYRTGESKPGEKELLAICSGFKLHPLISKYLFKQLRLDIFETYEEPYPFYVDLLNTCYKLGREKWNTMIAAAYPNNMDFRI